MLLLKQQLKLTLLELQVQEEHGSGSLPSPAIWYRYADSHPCLEDLSHATSQLHQFSPWSS